MKFTEATKDTQIVLLAVALGGALESMSKHTDDDGKAITLETIRHIGLGLEDFKSILNNFPDNVKDEIFRITGVTMTDLPAVQVYRQSDFNALQETYRGVSDETLEEDALHDGAITADQLPMSRKDVLVAMLVHIEKDQPTDGPCE